MSEYTIAIGPSRPPIGGPDSDDNLTLIRGAVQETAGPDERPLQALVLIPRRQLSSALVHAQPVGLLHLCIDGNVCDEVVCAGEEQPAADLARFIAQPQARGRLCDAVRRAHPGTRCEVIAIDDVCRAEQVLGQAWITYLRSVFGQG